MTQEEIIRVTVQIQQAMAQFRKLRGGIDQFKKSAQTGFSKVADSVSTLDKRFGGFGKRALDSIPIIGRTILSLDKKILGMGKVAVGVFSKVGGAILSVPGKIRTLSTSLLSLSSRFQFIGFRLIAGLTLPLVRLGQTAFNVAINIEKEWIRVQKVYGDSSLSAADFARVQNDILSPAVLRISKKFAEHQTVILETMGTWAAAGKQGEELAAITEETLRVATLGEIDLTQATGFLKSMMASFGLTVEEVQSEVNAFNRIENETFLQMKDLARAFPIAGGAFKGFNLTAREGAAVLAGIAQRTGNATEAANAAKFAFSRLAGGMPIVNKTLKKLGVNLFDMTGKARPGVTVLREMATKLKGLSDEEKQEAMSRLFGNRQIVRMRALMESVLDPTSDFNKAIKVSADDTENAATAFKELNIILESQPKTWDGAKIAIENVMAVIGKQLAPVIIDIAKKIAFVAEKFTNLNPGIQKGILAFLAFLAAIGPVIFLVSQMGIVVAVLGLGLGLLLSPIGLVVAAIAGLATIFGLAILGSDDMKNDMVKAFEIVKDVVIDVWENNIKPVLETGKQIVDDVTKSIVDNWDNIKNAIVKAWSAVKPVLEFLWNVIGSLAEVIIAQLRPAWDELFAAITPLLPILGRLAIFFGTILLTAIVVVAAVLAGLAKGFRSFVTGIVNIFSGIVQTVSGVMDMVKGFLTGDWSLFKAGWSAVVDGMTRLFEGLVQVSLGVLAGFATGIADFFVNLVDRVFPGFIDGVVFWFEKLPGRIWDNIKFIGKQFAKVLPLVTENAKLILDGIVEIFKKLPGQMWEIIKLLPGLFFEVLQWIIAAIIVWNMGIITILKNLPILILGIILKIASVFFELVKKAPGFALMLITAYINIIRSLPGRVWTILLFIIRFFLKLGALSRTWGLKLVRGFLAWIKKLPGLVWRNLVFIARRFLSLIRLAKGWGLSLLRGFLVWIKKIPSRVWSNIKFIANKFKSLGKSAISWGKDLLVKFIQGIKNKIGWFKSQFTKLIPEKIRKILGFSLPKEGPLRQAGKWMPHMIQLLVKTLRKSSPVLVSSVSKLASQTSSAFGVGPSISGGGQTLEGRSGGFGGPVFIDQRFIYQPAQSFATPEEIRNLERQLMVARKQESIRTGGE